MMTNRLLIALAGLWALGACGHDTLTAPSSPSLESFTASEGGDSLALSSITPAPGTTLRAGQAVDFSVTVRYALSSADSGRIFLVIQREGGVLLQTPPQPVQPVGRGSGSVALSDRVVVPADATRIDLFVPMLRGDATNTELRLLVQFPVR